MKDVERAERFIAAVAALADTPSRPTVTTWTRGEEGPPMFTAHMTQGGAEYLLTMAPTDQSVAKS